MKIKGIIIFILSALMYSLAFFMMELPLWKEIIIASLFIIGTFIQINFQIFEAKEKGEGK